MARLLARCMQKLALRHITVTEDSAAVRARKEPPLDAPAERCGAAALVEDSLPYLCTQKFVMESSKMLAKRMSMVR